MLFGDETTRRGGALALVAVFIDFAPKCRQQKSRAPTFVDARLCSSCYWLEGTKIGSSDKIRGAYSTSSIINYIGAISIPQFRWDISLSSIYS